MAQGTTQSYAKWSDEDTATLVRMWPDHTQEQIAAVLKTTRRAVGAKAIRIGLPSKAVAEWPKERVEVLRQHYWNNLSYSQISEKMGCTYKSWKSKVDKLGMKRGPKPNPEPKVPRQRATLKINGKNQVVECHDNPPPKVILPAKAWEALPGTTPKHLTEHQQHQCKWPIGDDLLFCCAPTEVPYGTYCASHKAMSVVRVKVLT